MTRRRAILVSAGVAFLAAAAALPMLVRSRVRPIHEFPNVYYSEPGLWADFHQHRAPAGTGWVHLPKTHKAASYRSSSDPALLGFVRPEVCAQCHADQYEGFLETAHFRTSMEPSRATVLGEFDGEEGRLKTRDPQLVLEMISQGKNLFQRVVVEKDGEVYEHAERFDLVVGSGNHGQTYLYWQGNELYQLPVSFFSESGGWINSPGFYRDGTADFARAIGHRCLDCHATYFAAAAEADFAYDPAKEKYVLGVTCVRCHGHGWAHVQYHQTHPNDPSPRYIVHPARLPRDRANEVCAQCHSGVGQLLKRERTPPPGLGFWAAAGFEEAAAGAAGGFGVCPVASFVHAVGANRVGVVGGPAIGAERGQIVLASEQAVENVLHVKPDVQVVAMGRADDRQQDRRSPARFDTSYK